MSTRTLTLTAMLTALLCLAGPLTLPLPPVPLSLTTAVLMLAALLLGARQAALCGGVYLLLGLVGLPVFSGFSGGAGVLLGPTGGFLLGYLPATILWGWASRRTALLRMTGLAAGTLLLYALGTAWYMGQSGAELTAAVTVCVLPFLPGDVLKAAAALALAKSLRSRLQRAGLLACPK